MNLIEEIKACKKFNLNLNNRETIKKFFPKNWKENAYKYKVTKHKDNPLSNPETLIKSFLIYLTGDFGLRQAALKIVQTCIVPHISAVALWHRLLRSKEWFYSLCFDLRKSCEKNLSSSTIKRRIKIVDSTQIVEKGTVTSSWRIHYAINFDNLKCEEIKITTLKKGESLLNFKVNPGDIFIADRAYAKRNAIASVIEFKGDVLLRCSPYLLPLEDQEGKRIDCLSLFKVLKEKESKEWKCFFTMNNKKYPVRLCVLKKTEKQRKITEKKLKRKAQKNRCNYSLGSLELGGYIILVTTLCESEFTLNQVLELYRSRWFIELVFKRLKSLLRIGDIPKKNKKAAIACLYGKLFVSLLIESMISEGEFFFSKGSFIIPKN